jgi:hypothetical protein
MIFVPEAIENARNFSNTLKKINLLLRMTTGKKNNRARKKLAFCQQSMLDKRQQ